MSVAQVARSEGQLLTLTRALFDGTPPSVVAPLVVDTQKLEDRIGPTAMGVLQSTLAKGTVRALVHGGGWRRESRPIAPPELTDGRLWERHAPPELHFTRWSYALLAALLRHTGAKPSALRPPSDPGDGDHLLAFQVAQMLVALELPEPLALVRFSPLVQLGFAWYVEPLDAAFDWAAWLKGRTWMVEGLHDALANAWVHAEHRRSQVRTTERLVRRSRRQRAVFMGFLDALDTLGRPDLQDVFLSAGERLVPDPSNVAAGQALVPALDPAQPLSARADALRAAVAFVDALDRIRRSIDTARSVRFFDDDYDLSQVRLGRWEQFGNERMRVFAGLRDHLASGGI